jgi:hypothetical protein
VVLERTSLSACDSLERRKHGLEMCQNVWTVKKSWELPEKYWSQCEIEFCFTEVTKFCCLGYA